MNNQNILKFFGSRLDIKLDSSEYYDYELSKTQLDYNTEVLDFSTPITYNSLKIDDSLENFSAITLTIKLVEVDNTINDPNYIYSGLSVVFDYYDFVSHFDTTGYTYSHIILNNNIYTYTGITGEIHYFKIDSYNDVISSTSINISDFSKNFISCVEKLNDLNNCCSLPQKLNIKPWAYKFDTGSGIDNCSPIIRKRTEKGWTLDFVFNRDGLDWSDGSIFYYIGVRGDDDIKNYADNNLSFGFTNDGRIKWSATHYLGICQVNSGFTESYFVTNGQTDPLCVTDPTKDFNITITFERYKRLTDCDLESNSLITGRTLTNSLSNILTGQTPEYTYQEVLNKKWSDERKNRLGTLKIYLNGKPIIKVKNFEEVIPSNRGIQPFIQSWGGGTPLMGGQHEGVSKFNIKTIKYYEEPLDFVHVNHNFITRLNNFDFEICGGNSCSDNLIGLGSNISLNLKAIFTPGSIRARYILTSDKPLPQPITLNFINNLDITSGTPITITDSISIPQNGVSGGTVVNLSDDYNSLNLTASYSGLTVTPVLPNTSFTINYEFIFAPKDDLTYVIIPNNDLNYNIIPNGDLSYLIIPNNLSYLIIPNDDVTYNIIPNGDLSYLIIPTGDLNYQILP